MWEWLEWIEDHGDKIGKSLSQKRKKFLSGFPESFDIVIQSERLVPDPGNYKIPDNYPAHHPKAGAPNPDRGKPDLDPHTGA